MFIASNTSTSTVLEQENRHELNMLFLEIKYSTPIQFNWWLGEPPVAFGFWPQNFGVCGGDLLEEWFVILRMLIELRRTSCSHRWWEQLLSNFFFQSFGKITFCNTFQGRIQDSRRRGRQPSGGRQHTILPNFPKNCMKLRKFWAVGRAPLDPPLLLIPL